MKNQTILVTGANGQIGSVLTRRLREKYGPDNVVATDIRTPEQPDVLFELLDVLDSKALPAIVKKYGVTQIYHLAAILSAKGESMPREAWQINMTGLFNVLEAAKEHGLKVFFPSSIAVFGPSTPREHTPQYTSMEPTTVYGISKAAGENWCQYYHKKYGIDVRSLRYPGIIGYESMPGGGTTDYAVEIFHRAVRQEAYDIFLREDTRLPMIYMADAIRATLELMEAPAERISVRTSYNLNGMSFSPGEIVAEIQKQLPDFKVTYTPDFRQQIADSWSESIDDSLAQSDWGWKPRYDLSAMTRDMLLHLEEQYTETVK